MTTATENLTANEKAMILAIPNSDYASSGPESTIWSWSVCETRSKAAVLGSLIKKGYVSGQSGMGNDATCRLTPLGIRAYGELTA